MRVTRAHAYVGESLEFFLHGDVLLAYFRRAVKLSDRSFDSSSIYQSHLSGSSSLSIHHSSSETGKIIFRTWSTCSNSPRSFRVRVARLSRVVHNSKNCRHPYREPSRRPTFPRRLRQWCRWLVETPHAHKRADRLSACFARIVYRYHVSHASTCSYYIIGFCISFIIFERAV